MADREKWVWFSEALYKGSRKASLLLSRANIDAIYSANKADYLSFGVPLTEKELSSLLDKDLSRTRKIISDCEKLGIRIITQDNSEYPDRLREILDAPVLLYAKGLPLAVDGEVAVAIVGTRRTSPHGKRAAEKLSAEIAEAGGIVVSGMARGIDAIAMNSALNINAYTIGVLGTGLDICYPAENRPLMRKTEKLGTLLSEYAPKTKPDKINFPKRNRIISALSLGVLVVEAPEKSGALITARIALEQNRDVFAVPSGIFESSAKGSNSLIREGATPVMSAMDILSGYAALFPGKITEKTEPQSDGTTNPTAKVEPSPEFLSSHSPDEQNILLAIANGNTRADEISAACDMPIAKTLSLLTLMEIRGSIKQLPGSHFEIRTN